MEENELYNRIGETDLNPTYKDGQTYQHTDINQMLGILKTAINENYYDIQRLLNGAKTVGNANQLDSATLSRYIDETLQADDNKIPSSQQAKAYMDALFAGYSAPVRGVDYWTEADQQQIVSDTASNVIEEITPDLEEALDAKANINDIPTKISDLQNDSDFLSENNLQMVNTTNVQNGTQLTDATGYARLNKIYGNTVQNGTPTINNPVDIDVVTGDVNVTISNADSSISQNYLLSLGNIELCKKNDYKDYIYYENEKWYLHKEINKVILNGSEAWVRQTASNSEYRFYTTITDILISLYPIVGSDYFALATGDTNRSYGIGGSSNAHRLYIRNSQFIDISDLTSWLSSNNTTVYYLLSEPVNVEITDPVLLQQLSEIKNFTCYEVETDFVITSNNLLPDLDITYAITNRDFYSKEETNDLLDKTAQDLNKKNLKWFCVTPTNTQTEIQNIMNVKGAKVIEFKTGNYNFSDSFRLNADTTLLLNNSTLTFSVQHGFFNFLSDDTFLEYNGNGNIKIVGGTIIGGNCSFCHARNIEFNNIHFFHCLNDHILEMASINNLLVDGCIFEGVAIQGESRNYVECIQLDDMTRSNFPWFSDSENVTYDNTPNCNFEIKNNKFINPLNESYSMHTAIGGHTAVEGAIHTNINIYHNVFDGNTNNAIRLRNVNKANIFSNVFKNGIGSSFFSTIALMNTAENITIDSNNVDCNGNTTFVNSDTKPINLSIINNIVYNSYYPEDEEYVIDDKNWIIYSRASINLVISNNYFHNFNKGLLTINNSEQENSSILFTNNNISTEDICNVATIRLYGVEKAILTNNIFDLEVEPSSYIIRLFQRMTKYIMKNNKFKSAHDYSYARILDINSYAGSLKEIEGLYFVAFTGKNTNTLTNQTLNYAYTDFNTLVLVCGTTNNTKYIKLKAYYILENLDARTYKIPVVADDGTVGSLIFTLNSDGTVSGSTNVTGANFRALYLINE